MSEVMRANKITAGFVGDGVIRATFYKTHEKLVEVKSTDDAVVNAGFAFKQNDDGTELAPNEKLAQFKEWVSNNANLFNVHYDNVDRREQANKFPSKYTEENLKETAQVMVIGALTKVAEKAQTSINKLIESDQLPVGTTMEIEINGIEVNVQEAYTDGNLKYADVTFDVVVKVAENVGGTKIKARLVSGQLSKPREMTSATGEVVSLTLTNIKNLVGGLKVSKPAKEEPAEENTDGADVVAENAENAE